MSSTSGYEKISPDTAKKFLANNDHNRPVNENNLQGLVSAIKLDKFKDTGESIKISKTGALLDGQHRLLAIVATGVTLNLNVVRGLPDESFKYIDTGRGRNAADVLAIEGFKNSTAMAGVIKFIISFQRGRYVNAAMKHAGAGNAKITNADVFDYMEKHQESLVESFPYGHTQYNKLYSKNLTAALHYLFKKINREAADDFFEKFVDGTGLKKSDSIYILRNALQNDIRATKKMSSLYKLALVCKTWNSYRTGKPIVTLKWEPIREPFPKPI